MALLRSNSNLFGHFRSGDRGKRDRELAIVRRRRRGTAVHLRLAFLSDIVSGGSSPASSAPTFGVWVGRPFSGLPPRVLG